MAMPFGDFDARSAGMGSVGVATSSLASAAFYNPAMLNHQEEASDFELFIVAGVRGSDTDRLLDDIDDFNVAVDAVNDVEARRLFEQSLGKSVALSAHAGASFGINAESFNFALIGQRYVHAALRTTGPVTNPSLDAIGIDITEVGLATSFGLGDFSIGLTPKSQAVTTYDYNNKSIINIDTDYQDIFDEAGERDHGSNLNLDLGVVYKISDASFAGLTVRNLSSQTFTTARGRTIELEPQARFGLGYRNDYFRIGIDVDVTENKAIAFEDKTQYAAIGMELNGWDWLQLRLGYRDNIAADAKSDKLMTVGLGIRLFGSVGIDLAAQANETNTDANEVGGYATVVASF